MGDVKWISLWYNRSNESNFSFAAVLHGTVLCFIKLGEFSENGSFPGSDGRIVALQEFR